MPVLEFDPGLFRRQDHPFPDATFDEDPQGWQSYRVLCWADAGIHALKTYRNSEFVRLEDIDEPLLWTFLNNHLELNDTDPFDMEQVSGLPGGCLLELDDGAMIQPRCCGALEDWHNWAEACETPLNESCELWIGHPQLSVKSVGPEHVAIRELQEFGQPKNPQEFTVDRSELRRAIHAIEEKIATFKVRVATALNANGFAQADKLAATLVGN